MAFVAIKKSGTGVSPVIFGTAETGETPVPH